MNTFITIFTETFTLNRFFFIFLFSLLSCKEEKKCNGDGDSKYIASGRPLYICINKYDKRDQITIILKKNKRVKFYLLDKDQGIYFSKDRILKIDTICIRINNNNKINIYGFKNEIEEFRFGENKGTYQCNLCYNENGIKNIFTRTDTIYVN